MTEPTRHRACECLKHQAIFEDAPGSDVELTIASCMRTCLYCGRGFKSAFSLREHLKRKKYTLRNIRVNTAASGMSEDNASWTPNSVSNSMTTETPALVLVSTSFMETGKSVKEVDEPSKKMSPPVHTNCTTFGAPTTFESAIIACSLLEGNKLEASAIVTLLRTEDGAFPKSLLDTLEDTHLHSLSSLGIDLVERRVWETSTTSIPRKISAASCWDSTPPEPCELWEMMLFPGSQKAVPVYKNGFRDYNTSVAAVFEQLHNPDKYRPKLAIVEALPSKTSRLSRIFTTPGHGLPCTAERTTGLGYNLTPKYTFVDIHIDSGLESLSACIGPSVKVWILFPPTAKNLRLLAQDLEQSNKLSTLASKLEGGVVLTLQSDEALYFPPGTLHAVFTVQGGFLVGTQFWSRESIVPFTNFYLSGCAAGVERMPELYLDALEISLARSRQPAAMKSWSELTSRKITKKWAEDEKWRRHAFQIWQTHYDLQAVDSSPAPELNFLSPRPESTTAKRARKH